MKASKTCCLNAATADEFVIKDSMGDVEDGDVFSVSAIDDCAGNGDNAVVNVFVIVGMGDGDDGTVVDVCAISVDTSVIDDDDVDGGFVINDDICNGDGGWVSLMMMILQMFLLSMRIWLKVMM